MIYRCLVADPPWLHGDKLPGEKRGAVKHYDCMATADICRMQLPPLNRDCWLFLWNLHTHKADALTVARAWGFGTAPCGEIIWVKTRLDGTGIRIGMGHSVRMAHESCLIFRAGRPERLDASIPSVIMAPRLEHSRKPDEFYRMVDRLVAGPKVEMFARRQWPGWRCSGNELPEAAE